MGSYIPFSKLVAEISSLITSICNQYANLNKDILEKIGDTGLEDKG